MSGRFYSFCYSCPLTVYILGTDNDFIAVPFTNCI